MSRFFAAIVAAVLCAPAALGWTVEHEVAVTADKEVLAIKRLANPGGPPVLMLHGFGSNMYEFDLPSKSFARHLADRGFDVWLANWRRSGIAPFRSTGRAGYTFDDVLHEDVPALVEAVRAKTGERPFLLGHSMGAMVACAYLQGCRLERALVARVPRLTWGGVAWQDVHAMRMGANPALAAQRNAGVRGLVAIAGPVRFAWKHDARLWDFWRYSYWDYDIVLRELAWSPSGIVAAHTVPEVPGRALTDFLTDDLVRLPYVGPDVRPFLALVAAQVGTSYLTSHVVYPPNIEGHVVFEALDLAVDDASTGVIRQFMDGIREQTMRDAHVFDPLRPPYVYADHYDRITTPALVVAGTKDKICSDDVLYRDGYLRMGSADRTWLAVDAGHVDIVMGKNVERDVWDPVAAWLSSR